MLQFLVKFSSRVHSWGHLQFNSNAATAAVGEPLELVFTDAVGDTCALT